MEVDVEPLPLTQGSSTVRQDDDHVVDTDAFETHLEPDDDTGDEDKESTSPTQLSDGLVTLSSLPKSKWANLSKLADIKQRNKPIEPPKAPKAAPFFLPTKEGLTSEFAFADDELPDLEAGSSRVLNFGKIGAMSPFQKSLIQAGEADDYSTFAVLLKSLTPSQLDLEIRSLSVEDDMAQLRYFLAFVAHQLQARRDFELTQSYLHLFLKVHGDVLRGAEATQTELKQVLVEHDMCWLHLEGLFQHALSTINFLKGHV